MISTLLLFWSKLYKFSHFRNVAVKNTLVKSPEKRPTIQELKAALIAGV